MEFTHLLLKLQKDYPNLNIELGSSFSWNSKHSRITYLLPQKEDHVNKYSNKLLHEVAHSILEHVDYRSDAELLKIESSTWELTKRLAKSYDISFNTREQHDSLASYIAYKYCRPNFFALTALINGRLANLALLEPIVKLKGSVLFQD